MQPSNRERAVENIEDIEKRENGVRNGDMPLVHRASGADSR